MSYTIWLYGKPAAGKTTIAAELTRLIEGSLILDGDEFRSTHNRDLGFSPEDRFENIKRACGVAREKNSQGTPVIAAFVTPFQYLRDYLRANIDMFFDVYLLCPVRARMCRDYKGNYRRALNGEIRDFTGVDQVFEPPGMVDLVVHTDVTAPSKCASIIYGRVKRWNF